MADIKKAGAALSRRNVLAGIGGSAAALALAACGSSSSGATSSSKPLSASTSLPKSKLSLTMFWWSGFDSVARQYIADYTERHPNVSVKLYLNSNALGYPKIVAQRQVDRSKPLVNFGLFNGTTRQEGVTDKMWSAMDFSSLSNAKDIIPSMVPADKFGIGLSTEQLGLIYNTKTAPAPLASWNDLLKPTYKGDMVIFTEPWWAVFMAAKLHGGGIDNMQPGWDLWQQAAKNGQIKLTVTDNSAYVNALSNGTASITSYFAGTAQLWINSGAPLKYVTPAEGAVPSPNYLCVVDDSTEDQKAVALDMINELISPKWSALWSESSVELSANANTKLSGAMASLPQFQASAAKSLVDVDWSTIGKNIAAWNQKWTTDVGAYL